MTDIAAKEGVFLVNMLLGPVFKCVDKCRPVSKTSVIQSNIDLAWKEMQLMSKECPRVRYEELKEELENVQYDLLDLLPYTRFPQSCRASSWNEARKIEHQSDITLKQIKVTSSIYRGKEVSAKRYECQPEATSKENSPQQPSGKESGSPHKKNKKSSGKEKCNPPEKAIEAKSSKQQRTKNASNKPSNVKQDEKHGKSQQQDKDDAARDTRRFKASKEFGLDCNILGVDPSDVMSYMYGVVCDKAEGRSVNSDRVVHLIKECMAKPSSKDKPRAALTKEQLDSVIERLAVSLGTLLSLQAEVAAA